MKNCNSQKFTLLLQPQPKMQEKISRLGNKPYKYALLNGQKFIALPKKLERKEFHRFMIDFGVTSLQVPSSPDYLTFCESNDVEVSLAEIKAGRAKRFESVDDFLKELKE